MQELKNVFKITVNGKELSAYPGETYLDVFKREGIYVPTLCHEKDLIPMGSCRLCVIEVEGSNRLLPSCSTQVVNNATVFTDSKKVIEARTTLIDLIVQQHPLDCMVCDKQGNCTLQKLAYQYLPVEKLYEYERPPRKYKIEINEFFKFDPNYCIKCGKCVQVVEEIQLCGVLSMENRGVDMIPSTGFDRTFEEAGCVACGNCVAVCPVNAFEPISLIKNGREVDSNRTVTTCTYCGVGCQFELVTHKEENRIIYVDSHRESVVNGLALCVKGRYGWDYVHHEDRINTPFIRRNGELQPATWEEAYDLIEQKFREILEKHGSDAFAFLSSAKCTNEENYLMQKLARAAIKTNNVDHCARLCHASTVTGLIQTFGSGAMTNSIHDLTNDAEVIFIIGSNTTETHPVIGIKIKQAVAKGKTKLIVADPRNIELAEIAEIHLRQRPGSDLALINAMMKVILDENLIDHEFIAERTENFDELKEMLEKLDLNLLSKITSVSVEDIRKAALLYANAGTAAIVYAMGITQHFTGTYNVAALANLAMMTGNVGKPGTGVNPLRGQNNVQGACDLGGLPDVFPGYQKVNIPDNISKFEKFWEVNGMSSTPGLTLVEIMDAALDGEIKAMMIMGENPALSDPNANKVRKALDKLDFLVVQDLFLSETAKYADVILPAMSFAEKDGTFTNTERRVQMVRKALDKIGDRKPDWQILNDLLLRFGVGKRYNHPSEIMDEIKQITPIYGGISYNRIEKVGLSWPVWDDNHPGTAILHSKKFSRGKGRFLPMDYLDPAETPDEEYPLILTTGRNLFHFHTGEMTHRSKGLHERRPFEITEVNTKDAETLGIVDGQRVKISSRRGTLEAIIKVTDKIIEGVVFMTFHYRESAANLLTNDVLDPYAKIPELKVAAVRIDKID